MKAYTQATDLQLIYLFQDGNDRALEILLSRYKDKIFSSILFLIKDKYLAEDIFQEMFIKVIDTLRNSRYIDEGKFLPWAMRVAHNMCIDHFRKIKRNPFVRTSDDSELFEDFVTTEPGAEVKLMQAELHEQVRQSINMLPDDQREVIVLRHYGDLSFRQIAEMTNCSINTALGRMRYGLINMRRILTEKQVAL